MKLLEVVRLIDKRKLLVGDFTVDSPYCITSKSRLIGIVVEEDPLSDVGSTKLSSGLATVQRTGTLNDGMSVNTGALYLSEA